MARIEDLADKYGRHISLPWQRTVSGAQRVIMIVYDKELERTLRSRKLAFENATRDANHDWHEVDVTDAFAHWMAADEYREAILTRWGPRALVSLAQAITAARSYPTVKYALGHGKACSRVVVAGAPTPVRHLEPLAA